MDSILKTDTRGRRRRERKCRSRIRAHIRQLSPVAQAIASRLMSQDPAVSKTQYCDAAVQVDLMAQIKLEQKKTTARGSQTFGGPRIEVEGQIIVMLTDSMLTFKDEIAGVAILSQSGEIFGPSLTRRASLLRSENISAVVVTHCCNYNRKSHDGIADAVGQLLRQFYGCVPVFWLRPSHFPNLPVQCNRNVRSAEAAITRVWPTGRILRRVCALIDRAIS